MFLRVEEPRVSSVGVPGAGEPPLGDARVPEPELGEPAVERIASLLALRRRPDPGLEAPKLGRRLRQPPVVKRVERRPEPARAAAHPAKYRAETAQKVR